MRAAAWVQAERAVGTRPPALLEVQGGTNAEGFKAPPCRPARSRLAAAFFTSD